MERFAEIVNGYKSLTISAKRSILDVWHCPEYASGWHIETWQINEIAKTDIARTNCFHSFTSNLSSKQK